MCITQISSLPEKIAKLIGSHDILIHQNEWILEFAEWNATNVIRAIGQPIQIYQNGLPLNENTAGNHHANPFGGENGNPDGVSGGPNGSPVVAFSWGSWNPFGVVGGPVGDLDSLLDELRWYCNQFGASDMIAVIHRMLNEEFAVDRTPPHEPMNLPSSVNPYAGNTVEYSLFGPSQPLVDVLGIVRECTYDHEVENKP